jgi:trimeric autotransporter adhesin
MQRKVDQWTTALAVLAIVGTLLACKKRTSATAPATETAAAAPTTPAPPLTAPPVPATAPAEAAAAAADPSAPKVGEVKRYPDKEKAQTGAVRILAADVKVYNEADDKTAEVATLPKDLLVFRIASVPDYELVEFPSGVGKVSPGWVLAKLIDAKASSNVERAAVASQPAQAVVKAAPKASASAAAKPATSAVASAKAAADKAAADKAAADKAAADKAAADKAAADKAAADRAAARAKVIFDRTKKAAEAAAAGK